VRGVTPAVVEAEYSASVQPAPAAASGSAGEAVPVREWPAALVAVLAAVGWLPTV
jgi:hypothetical protein